MREFTYKVLMFRQQENAPVQVAFVAHASEVLAWAGVPRKSDELLTGFQRFRDVKRIDDEIVPFFQNASNCSPTAVIVALRSKAGIGRCILSPSNVAPGEVKEGVLKVQLDDQLVGTKEIFSAAQKYVAERLASDPAPQGASQAEAAEDEAEDEAEGVEDAGDEGVEATDESDASDEIMHLGSATLNRMKEILDDKANWEKPAFREAIEDYVKPAFLIDGQHRISAAAKFGDNGLPFMICGLFDAPWEEQVFQFTVVNLKPKRIPPSLITAIAGLSLTRSEHDKVQKRLEQAGVKVAEVEIMSLVNYDESSPFYEKVNMAVGGAETAKSLLGYGGMKRIAKVWYRAHGASLSQIARAVCDSKNTASAKTSWRVTRIWFEFFCAFWTTVRENYSASLWEKSEENHLLVAANLWALQDVLMREADSQVKSHWNVDGAVVGEEKRSQVLRNKLLEVVRSTLEYFPEELWTCRWEKGSQDTNAGRQELVKFLRQFVDEGKAAGRAWRGWKNSDWFKREKV